MSVQWAACVAHLRSYSRRALLSVLPLEMPCGHLAVGCGRLSGQEGGATLDLARPASVFLNELEPLWSQRSSV